MKILALDIGDVWVGSALSDPLGITCKPYKTIKFPELKNFLKQIIIDENIKTIVIGYPKTLKGKESEQTKKIVLVKNKLEQDYKAVEWILWDERLSSKRAKEILGKKEKQSEHSIAAAFILQSYLDYKAFHQTQK